MFIYNYWPQKVGGAEVQCRRLSHELQKRSIGCTIITARLNFRDKKSEMDSGVRIRRIFVFQPFMEKILSVKNLFFRKTLNEKDSTIITSQRNSENTNNILTINNVLSWLNCLFFICSCFIECLLRRKDFDIYHVHTTEWLAGAIIIIGRLFKIPVVCKEATTPALMDINFNVPFWKALDRNRYRGKYIAMNSLIKNQFFEKGIAEQDIFIIPNGISIPDKPSMSMITNNVLWIGNISQGIKTKGLDVLVKAWRRVVEKRPESRLFLVGGGDFSPIVQELNLYALNDTVKIIGFTQDVTKYYLSTDVVVVPSRREGMSNVILEALSFGVPVIASDIVANVSVIKDGRSGFLYPIEEYETLAEKILFVLEDDLLRSNMGRFARKDVSERFSFEVVTDKLVDCYLKLQCDRDAY